MGWTCWFSQGEAKRRAKKSNKARERGNNGYCLGFAPDKGEVFQYNVVAAADEDISDAIKVISLTSPPVCLVNMYGEIQAAGREFCEQLSLPVAVESLARCVRNFHDPLKSY
jgi:hypothetical protein